MTLWLLLILVLDLQGYCLGVQKNETRLSGHASTQLNSTDSPPSTVLHVISGKLRSSQDAGTDQVISTTVKYSTSISDPRNRNKHITNASQTATSRIPKAITTTIKSRVKPTVTEESHLSEFPVQAEVKTESLSTNPVTSPTTLSSSQKPPVLTTAYQETEETSSDDGNHKTQYISRKTIFSKTSGTKATQAHISSPEDHSSEEISEESEASTGAATEIDPELATSTPAETSTEEETSTIVLSETTDWPYSETDEVTTESASENNFSYTTTDVSTDPTTTDLATDQNTEHSTTDGPSIPNGIASHESQPLRGVSSPLTKLILRLSKPGVFEKGKSVFEDDTPTMTTSCPPGDVGLSCRRAEARKGADECSGGNCEVCRSCNIMAAIDWPHCCRENFRCCSELALACQQCDQPTLQVFCTKHFKRCF